MKKQFKIHRVNPGFKGIDLIEDDKTVGGYIIPTRPYIEGLEDIIINAIEKEGYVKYEKTNNIN